MLRARFPIMAFTVRFKNKTTNAYAEVQYQAGAVLPKVNDRIISPFNDEKWINVIDIEGQISGSPYEILVQE
jgi:hypothetical protein